MMTKTSDNLNLTVTSLSLRHLKEKYTFIHITNDMETLKY